MRVLTGSPWENGYNEQFNGTLRREVLDAEWFATTRQAQAVIDIRLKQYNHIRPHEALGMRPPVPETIVHMDHRPVMHRQSNWTTRIGLLIAFAPRTDTAKTDIRL